MCSVVVQYECGVVVQYDCGVVVQYECAVWWYSMNVQCGGAV